MVEPLPPRYSDARLLGEGSFGTVYAARDLLLDRPVAVKILREDLAFDRAARQRFGREAQTAALVGTHPHVATVHDAGEWRGRPYLVLELLESHIRSGVPEAAALRWLAQAASALDFVHAFDIVHRDVKPANLLLDAHGDVRLTDFGVARGGTLPALTEPGAVVGTPGYLAPEVAAGGVATSASDVYSFAVVARELLGDRPELAAALSADPASRPAFATAVVAALGGDEAPTRVLAPEHHTIVRIPRTKPAPAIAPAIRRRRMRRSVGVFGVAAVAALAAAGGAFIATRASATASVKTPAQQPHQTCALSAFHHDANVVLTGAGATRLCRTQAHVLRLRGDEWSYRSGGELFAPDHGTSSLHTVCRLSRGAVRLRVYDSGARAIGGDLCRWYGDGGWRAA